MNPTVSVIVNTYGTKSQIARYRANVLPENDLNKLIKYALRQQFTGFNFRRRIEHADVEDLAIKRGLAVPGTEVFFTIMPVESFRDKEWSTLEDIKERLEKLSTYWVLDTQPSVTTFWLVCMCGDFDERKAYARVGVTVGEQEYTLELCLK